VRFLARSKNLDVDKGVPRNARPRGHERAHVLRLSPPLRRGRREEAPKVLKLKNVGKMSAEGGGTFVSAFA
jgi:hypothetical protein